MKRKKANKKKAEYEKVGKAVTLAANVHLFAFHELFYLTFVITLCIILISSLVQDFETLQLGGVHGAGPARARRESSPLWALLRLSGRKLEAWSKYILP